MSGAAVRPAGRPAGTESTREVVLAAAQSAFAATGFEGTSVRAVAAEAGVDPSTVLHFFGSKDGLFTAVIAAVVPATAPLVEGIRDGVGGTELVRRYLAVWEGEQSRPAIQALLRAGIGSERAAELLRATLLRRLLDAAGDVAPIGVELALTQLIGMGIGRYVLGLTALRQAEAEAVAVAVGPTIDRCLAMRASPS